MVRNALIPFMTVLGIQFGYLLGGAVVIEQVFGLPGIGRTVVQAVFDRDSPPANAPPAAAVPAVEPVNGRGDSGLIRRLFNRS